MFMRKEIVELIRKENIFTVDMIKNQKTKIVATIGPILLSLQIKSNV